MRAFVDTNLFVYATYSRFPQFEKAREFLKSCLSGFDSWYLSWGVVYEYLRVVTHPQIFLNQTLPFPLALENVLKFCAAPNVEILLETEDHPRLLQELPQEYRSLGGNILHDAHSVLIMREHDLRTIYSTDTDFHRFQGIEVLNPLQ